MSLIMVTNLKRNNSGGITVVTNHGTAYNVNPNIIRCCLGSADMDYLLRSNGGEVGFGITGPEFADMFCERGI